MGVAILDKNAVFPVKNSLGKIVPASSPQYLLFGGDNYAKNQTVLGAAGAINGTISNVTADSSQLSENGFINSKLAVGLNGSYIAVFRVYANSGGNNTVLGTFPYNAGISLMFGNNAIFGWFSDNAGNQKGISLSHTSTATDFKAGDWVCACVRWSTDSANTTTVSLDILNKGLSGSQAGAAGVPIKTTTTTFASIRLGTGYINAAPDTSGKGNKEVAFLGVWGRNLSALEMNAMYSYLKTYMAKRSITL